MSKFKKMIFQPKLFLSDFLKKRGAHKNIALKKVLSKDIDLSHVNPLINYEFIYHCGESYEAGYHHLNSWLPYFVINNFNFLLILRNEKIYKWACEEFPFLNIAFARKTINIEQVINAIKTKKIVLYSSASVNNGQLIRFNDFKHIFIGHGDSEKAGSAHKGHRWFDEIWTAGQAHIDRYKNTGVNFDGLKFFKVGRPILKNIIKYSLENTQKPGDSCKALYLPTWEGVFDSHNYSSVRICNEILTTLSSRTYTTSAKFHPYTGGRLGMYSNVEKQLLPVLKGMSNIKIINRSENLLNIIHFYDCFVCDISSVVSECLPLNKPIFLYLPKDIVIDIAKSNVDYEEYCYIFSDAKELAKKMDDVFSGEDYLANSRKKAIDYFVGIEETLNDEFAKRLRSY